MIWFIVLLNPVTTSVFMWGLFIAGTRIAQKQHAVPTGLWRLMVALFFFIDAAYDWIYGSLFFLEEPKELTFTQRVSRHKHFGTGWRKRLAEWICRTLFEPWDCEHCDNRSTRYWR